jgi:hypothetical protein
MCIGRRLPHQDQCQHGCLPGFLRHPGRS